MAQDLSIRLDGRLLSEFCLELILMSGIFGFLVNLPEFWTLSGINGLLSSLCPGLNVGSFAWVYLMEMLLSSLQYQSSHLQAAEQLNGSSLLKNNQPNMNWLQRKFHTLEHFVSMSKWFPEFFKFATFIKILGTSEILNTYLVQSWNTFERIKFLCHIEIGQILRFAFTPNTFHGSKNGIFKTMGACQRATSAALQHSNYYAYFWPILDFEVEFWPNQMVYQ